LLHWLSACLYVAIATGLSVKANTTAVKGLPPVQGVLLPQVRRRTVCSVRIVQRL
jgi:hypothetical protein